MKLIYTQDYLLLIDKEAEIKEGTKWVFDKDRPEIIPLLGNTNIVKEGIIKGWFVKIIAYSPLNSKAKELDLPLLPPFKDVNIEELAEKWYIDNIETSNSSYNDINSFIEGYKAAQPKQFTLEDMKIAFHKGRLYQGREGDTTFESFIQSLSTQQLPKEFIPEYTWEWFDSVNDTGWENISPSDMDAIIAHGLEPQPKFRKRLKTITNSSGKIELVGTYKY